MPETVNWLAFFDWGARSISGPAGEVALSQLMSDFLMVLIKKGSLVRREEMMSRLYGSSDSSPYEKSLDVLLHRLRARLRAAGLGDTVRINTVHGTGWVLRVSGEKREP